MASEHDPLTPAEAAQELGVTAGRIRQLIDSGELPAMKRGRHWFIRRADLDSLRRRRMAPGPAKMTSRPTNLQRQVERGALQLPAVRPASVSERAWAVLVRHVRDRVPYTGLGAVRAVIPHAGEAPPAADGSAMTAPVASRTSNRTRDAVDAPILERLA